MVTVIRDPLREGDTVRHGTRERSLEGRLQAIALFDQLNAHGVERYLLIRFVCVFGSSTTAKPEGRGQLHFRFQAFRHSSCF